MPRGVMPQKTRFFIIIRKKNGWDSSAGWDPAASKMGAANVWLAHRRWQKGVDPGTRPYGGCRLVGSRSLYWFSSFSAEEVAASAIFRVCNKWLYLTSFHPILWSVLSHIYILWISILSAPSFSSCWISYIPKSSSSSFFFTNWILFVAVLILLSFEREKREQIVNCHQGGGGGVPFRTK